MRMSMRSSMGPVGSVGGPGGGEADGDSDDSDEWDEPFEAAAAPSIDAFSLGADIEIPVEAATVDGVAHSQVAAPPAVLEETPDSTSVQQSEQRRDAAPRWSVVLAVARPAAE